MRKYAALTPLTILVLATACGSSEPETREELAERIESITGQATTPEEADQAAGWMCGTFAMAAEFDIEGPTTSEVAEDFGISESDAQELIDVMMAWRCPDGPEGEPANMPTANAAPTEDMSVDDADWLSPRGAEELEVGQQAAVPPTLDGAGGPSMFVVLDNLEPVEECDSSLSYSHDSPAEPLTRLDFTITTTGSHDSGVSILGAPDFYAVQGAQVTPRFESTSHDICVEGAGWYAADMLPNSEYKHTVVLAIPEGADTIGYTQRTLGFSWEWELP